MRTFVFIVLFIFQAGCFLTGKKNVQKSELFLPVYSGDSTLSGAEWIEISYRQSGAARENKIWVYHLNQKMALEPYLKVMGEQMTYPLYLQKVKMEGNAIYTIRKAENGTLNLAMSAGTINRSYSEVARWIMPIKYGQPTPTFGINDSVMLQIKFRRKSL